MNPNLDDSDRAPGSDESNRYSRLELDRLRKIDEMRNQGVDPFPGRG